MNKLGDIKSQHIKQFQWDNFRKTIFKISLEKPIFKAQDYVEVGSSRK